MNTDFRMNQYPPYVFNIVSEFKNKLESAGHQIIDLGMGNPDGAAPDYVVQTLINQAQIPVNHRYNNPRGIAPLREAISQWYADRFNVHLDAERETIVTLGSKEGLAHLALAITKPQDKFLVPCPAYPIHQFGFEIAQGVLQRYPVGSSQSMLANIKSSCEEQVPKALLLNFPSNPTAQVVDIGFLEECVALAKHYGFWIIHDFAYADIFFEQRPPSILQVKGAKDVAVESYSLSKSYNMAGWRVGFMSGNKTLISALGALKAYYDYGLFAPIQLAAITALQAGDHTCAHLRKLYKKRRNTLCQGLQQIGWDIKPPSASMFCWAKIPEYFNMRSLEFVQYLMQHANVAVAPGIGFGEQGENFVRIALIEPPTVLEQAVQQISPLLKTHLIKVQNG